MMQAKIIALALAAALATGTAAQSLTAPAYQRASQKLLEEGRKALAAGEPATALKRFEEALVADPANVAALVAIGRAHEAMGQQQAARGYYLRALTVDPAYLPALEAEALLALKMGDREKALADLKAIQEICAPRDCPEQARVATALREAGEEEAAGSSSTRPDASAGPPRN